MSKSNYDAAKRREASVGAKANMRTVHAVFCNNMAYAGIAHTVWELLENLRGPHLQRRLWYIGGDPTVLREYHRPAFSHLIWRTLLKARIPRDWQGRVVVEAALREVQAGDVVYVWPPYNLSLISRAKQRRAIVVAERVNCMGPTCKSVLDRAYARLGQNLPEGLFSSRWIAEEIAQMAMCDLITAPNNFVTESLVNVGIPRERILETSYGWSPKRLASALNTVRDGRVPVFAFVGSGIVRKGLNLLLEAWEKAEVKGRLLIAGRIEDNIRRTCARQLSRPDVQELGYVHDVANVYRAADVFVLPTHEEGGPQVTYEAAGCGLASIVSPMGAGRIVRDGAEGFVIDPYDIEGWARAIRALAHDAALRRRLAASASTRAKDFTWQRVGNRLYELLLEHTGELQNS